MFTLFTNIHLDLNPRVKLARKQLRTFLGLRHPMTWYKHLYDCARVVYCLPIDLSKSPKFLISVF